MTLPMNRLRNLAESYMPLTVEVITTTEGGTDPSGYPTEGAETVSATTKGRLRGMSGSEQVIAQQLTETVSGTLLIPVGVNVSPQQTVRVDGERYHVSHVETATPKYQGQTKVMVSRAD